MQEEVEQRTLTLVINGTKFSGRVLKNAVSKFVAFCRNQKAKKVNVHPKGKQSVKQLTRQRQGVNTMEIDDENLRQFERIARKYGVSVANVAVQYILRQKSVGAVMVGTRNSKHVESNVRTLQFDLSDEDMAAIRAFLDQYPTPEGECYELERTSPRYQSIILTDLNK